MELWHCVLVLMLWGNASIISKASDLRWGKSRFRQPQNGTHDILCKSITKQPSQRVSLHPYFKTRCPCLEGSSLALLKLQFHTCTFWGSPRIISFSCFPHTSVFSNSNLVPHLTLLCRVLQMTTGSQTSTCPMSTNSNPLRREHVIYLWPFLHEGG